MSAQGPVCRINTVSPDALKHVDQDAEALSNRMAADALRDPISKAVTDIDEITKMKIAMNSDGSHSVGTSPDNPTGMLPEDLKVKKRGMDHIMNRVRFNRNLIRDAANKPSHKRTKSEEKLAGQILTDRDQKIVSRFAEAMGESLFDNIHLRFSDRTSEEVRRNIRPKRNEPPFEGEFSFLEDIITISSKALQLGAFHETMIHEMWHHMSRYVDDKTVVKLHKQYKRDRAHYMKANPGAEARVRNRKWTPEEYRWVNFDEWFAETAKDRSLDKLKDFGDRERSVMLHIKQWMLEMVAAIKSKFGWEHTEKLVNDFFYRKPQNASWSGAKTKSILVNPTDWAFTPAPNRTKRSGQPKNPYNSRTSKHRQWGLEDGLTAFSKKRAGGKSATRVKKNEPEDGRIGLLRPLGLDENAARVLLSNVDKRLGLTAKLGINPRAKVKDPDGKLVYKYSKADLLDRYLSRRDLNLSHYSGPEDAISVIRTHEDLFRSVIGEDVEAVNPRTQAQQLADAREELGVMVATTSKDDQALQVNIERGLTEDVRQLSEIHARVLAYKNLQQSMGQMILKDLQNFKTPGGDSSEAMARLHSNVEFMANLTAGVKGLTALQGRGLSSGNIPIEGIIADPAKLQDFLQMRGGKKGTDRLVKILETTLTEGKMDSQGIGRVNQLIKPSVGKRVMNITTEYWINSILSGGKTLFVNGLGGVMMSVYRPMEKMLGASLTLNGQALTDATAELTYLFVHANDAFKMAWKSLKQGDNILDPGSRVLDLPENNFKAISARGVGLKDDSLMGSGVNFLGNTFRLPSRILTGTDEFFKQLNYRAKAHRMLVREGMGLGMKGDDLATHVHDRLAMMTEDGQAYSAATAYKRGVQAAKESGIIDPEEIKIFAQKYTQRPPEQGGFDHAMNTISKESLKVAEEVTFTRALAAGSTSAGIQAMVIRQPWMRFIVPFVRTPVNIAMTAGRRFDFLGASRVAYHKLSGSTHHLRESQNQLMKDFGSADLGKRAEAAGRAAAGSMAAVVLYGYANQGRMTGRGPADPELRQILKDAGWQPYSFKTKDGYVSYARVDPFATVMGTMADIHDYIRYSDIEDQEELSTALTGLVVALTQNFTNKTYLAGLSNVLQALEQPDRFVPKLARTYAASMIPFSSAQGQSLYAMGDPYMRDVQSMTEALMAKTPYYSDQVRPLRNFLGEPVKRVTAAGTDAIGSVMDLFQPISYTQFTDDTLKLEFLKLGHGFTPPKPMKYGLNLTNYVNPDTGQDAFDRWQELNGEIKINGKTLRGSMLSLVRNSQYQKLTYMSDQSAESPRIGLIKRILEAYKKVAFEQVKKEYPDLAEDFVNVFNIKNLRKRGVVAGGY